MRCLPFEAEMAYLVFTVVVNNVNPGPVLHYHITALVGLFQIHAWVVGQAAELFGKTLRAKFAPMEK